MNRSPNQTATQESQTLADLMAELIQTRDIERFSVVYHEDAEIWHNFDNKVQSKAQNLELLSNVFSAFKIVRYTNSRINFIDGGFVKQHNLECITQNNDVISMPTCQIISIEAGQIKAMAEYLDPTPLFSHLTQN